MTDDSTSSSPDDTTNDNVPEKAPEKTDQQAQEQITRNAQKRSAAQLAALKNDIIQTIGIQKFYGDYIPDFSGFRIKSDGFSEHVRCPLHGDQAGGTPNLSININSGGFHCFACGKKGSPFDFWCYLNGREPKTAFQDALIALADMAGIQIAGYKKEAPRPIEVSSGKEEPVTKAKAFVPQVNKAEAIDASRPPIARDEAIAFHQAMRPDDYKYLNYERGLDITSVEHYLIGWNAKAPYKDTKDKWRKGKLTVPVPCKSDLIRNIRLYTQHAPKRHKMINTSPYGSPPRLFHLPDLIRLNPEYLIYGEGEFDMMKMNQVLREAGLLVEHGWLCMTNTAGCNVFEPEWMPYFLGRNIILMMDVDPPGRQWAASHANNFFLTPLSTGKIKSLKVVHLPMDGTKGSKDIGDWFIKHGRTWADTMTVIEGTPQAIISKPPEKSLAAIAEAQAKEEIALNSQLNDFAGNETAELYQEISVEPIDVPNLVACVKNREYIDRRVRVDVTINGECTKLYHATRSLRVISCPLMEDGQCCSEGAGIQTIPYGDVMFIDACMASKRNMQSTLQHIACSKRQSCQIEEVEKVVMQEFFAHQVIRRLTAEIDDEGRIVNSQQLVNVSLYVLQPPRHIDIGPQDYRITGYVRSHPQTRQVTIFVEHMVPLEEDWKKFDIASGNNIAALKHIQGYPNVKQLLNELTTGVTQIYESDDILLTVLLTYLSPLWFAFNGKVVRGWLNTCIIGDSGTGKTATYLRVSDWLNLGDLFSALTGSRTGLLYSIQQKGGQDWHVQIGRYVIASGKIIAVDEGQALSPEETNSMIKAMDEGWLSVNRVASGGWQTQTRFICIMNPPNQKNISDFSYGCQSLTECFNYPFIRRLDIAIFTTGQEDIRFYNQRFSQEKAKEISLTPEIFRSLVYWVWTRTVNDIIWTEEATTMCLDKAVELSLVFGAPDDVPLVCPQDFRDTLARISVAFAILSGSFTEDYVGVTVLPVHVEKIAKFLTAVYSSSSCNLRQYSKNSSRKKSLHDYDKILIAFTEIIKLASELRDIRLSQGQHFLQMLLILQQLGSVRKRDLAEQLGVGLIWVQKHVAILQMFSLVEMNKNGYKATRKFNLFMQRWSADPKIEVMLDSVQERIGKLAMMSQDTDDVFGSDPVFNDYVN